VPQVLQVLLECQGDPNIDDELGKKPIHYAVRLCSVEGLGFMVYVGGLRPRGGIQ
jgi:hypothetical protein